MYEKRSLGKLLETPDILKNKKSFLEDFSFFTELDKNGYFPIHSIELKEFGKWNAKAIVLGLEMDLLVHTLSDSETFGLFTTVGTIGPTFLYAGITVGVPMIANTFNYCIGKPLEKLFK
jgi:hypothetical protein